MLNVMAIFKVLRYGNELRNVEAWKTGAIVATIVQMITTGVDIAKDFGYVINGLTPEIVTNLANGIHSFGLVFLLFVTAASSKRAGLLPPERPPVAEPVRPDQQSPL